MNQEDPRELLNTNASRRYPEVQINQSMAMLPINPLMYPPLMGGGQLQNSGPYPNTFMPNLFPNVYTGPKTLPGHQMSSNPIVYYPTNNRSPLNGLPPRLYGIPLFEHQPVYARQPAVLMKIENRDEKSAYATKSVEELKTETVGTSPLINRVLDSSTNEGNAQAGLLSARTQKFDHLTQTKNSTVITSSEAADSPREVSADLKLRRPRKEWYEMAPSKSQESSNNDLNRSAEFPIQSSTQCQSRKKSIGIHRSAQTIRYNDGEKMIEKYTSQAVKLIDLIGSELEHMNPIDYNANVRTMASQFHDLRRMILLINDIVAWSDERSHDDNTAHSDKFVINTANRCSM